MTQQCAEFCFAHENMKKTMLKAAYYNKIAKIFNTALTVQPAQNQQKYKIRLSIFSTWDM